MMPKNNFPVPDFQGAADKLLKEIPPNIAEMAKGFFKGSFFKEGFTDYGFIAWPRRKDEEAHKILTKSHALRDSIRIASATSQRIEIEAGRGLPYAEIHNTGGTIKITVTPKARRFFWYMFKKTGASKWKYMALTKKSQFRIYIPQRQYIGESQTLLKNIDSYIVKQIIQNFKNA